MSHCEVQVVNNAIQNIIDNTADENPFHVCDLTDIINKCRNWRHKLPRVEVFYAVKCCPDPVMLRLMTSLGMGFDCASPAEIKATMAAGATSSKIIYANPVKPISSLLYAKSVDVDLMTFDSEQELLKIKKFYPNAKLVLRIKTLNTSAIFPLSGKFGCDIEDVFSLLGLAKELDMNVMGVCFHVGALCQQPLAYAQAIELCRRVFDIAESLGIRMTMLDLGGGFPGVTGTSELFDKMCYFINQSLEEHFPEGCGVRILAEPGAYMVASAFSVYTTVVGKKMVKEDEESDGWKNISFMKYLALQTSFLKYLVHLTRFFYKDDEGNKRMYYYMNDSSFGSFARGLENHRWLTCFKVKPVLGKHEVAKRSLIRSKLWGVTCCNIDVIYDDLILPELEIGEMLVFPDMGSYSSCTQTRFNGFPKIQIHHVYSQQDLHRDNLPPFSEFCRELDSVQLTSVLKILNRFDGNRTIEETEGEIIA